MKKNTLYIIIAAALLVAAVVGILFKTGVFKSNRGYLNYDAFAVKDTASVTKVFLADMQGNYVLLQRSDGGWTVCDSILVKPAVMHEFLTTMSSLTIKQVVPHSGQNTINKVLATGAVKVDVYQLCPKFKLFGIEFGVKERKTKTYYMGPATMDNQSNFALLEGNKDPYIVYIPGFRGFATPIYSTNYADWINHDVFQTKITRIKSVEFIDHENPNESFRIEKTGARFFNVYDSHNQQVLVYDTIKLIDMLSEFRDKNFEDKVITLQPSAIDSIYQQYLFKTIILTDIEGKKTSVDFCHLVLKEVGEDGSVQLIPNEDSFYGIINNNRNEIYLFQYFHFDRQIQPLSYFSRQQVK